MYYHDMENFPSLQYGWTRIRLFDFITSLRQDVRIGVLTTVRLGLEQMELERDNNSKFDSSIHYLHLSYIDKTYGVENSLFLKRSPELGFKTLHSELSGNSGFGISDEEYNQILCLVEDKLNIDIFEYTKGKIYYEENG